MGRFYLTYVGQGILDFQNEIQRYLWSMRVLAGTLAIVLIVGPFWFAKMNLHTQLRTAKRQVKALLLADLPPGATQTFQFTSAEYVNLNWEHSKEFERNGVMYDVIDVKEINGLLQVICYPDTRESTIKQQLKKLLALEHKKPDSGSSTLPWDQLIKGIYANQPAQALPQAGAFDLQVHLESPSPFAGFGTILLPPPNGRS